jgi:hypothetical protein
MRPPVDAARIRELAHRLGRVAAGRTRVYLTGGATAVLEGWRASTIDVASPPDFIPELPGWRERSPLVFREGNVDVHHFDPYSQALSKIERGFARDVVDVQQMLAGGMVEPDRLAELFDAIEPQLYRYPAIHPPAFRRRLRDALSG